MIKKSLIISASVSGVVILYSIIASVIVILFFKDHIYSGPIVSLIQILVFCLATFVAGYLYSNKYNEVIPDKVIKISAHTTYFIQMVYAIPYIYLMMSGFSLNFFSACIALLLWNYLIYYTMSKVYLEKGSNLFIKRDTPELLANKDEKQTKTPIKTDLKGMLISIAIGVSLFIITSLLYLMIMIFTNIFFSDFTAITPFLMVIPIIVIMFLSYKIGYNYSLISKTLIPNGVVYNSASILVILIVFSYLGINIYFKTMNISNIFWIIINTIFFFLIYGSTVTFKLIEGSLDYIKERFPELLDDEELDATFKAVKTHLENKDKSNTDTNISEKCVEKSE